MCNLPNAPYKTTQTTVIKSQATAITQYRNADKSDNADTTVDGYHYSICNEPMTNLTLTLSLTLKICNTWAYVVYMFIDLLK